MFKFSKSNSKVPLLLIFALLIGSVLWLYLNRYLTQSRATQPKVNVTMVPETGNFTTGTEHTVVVFIQPADTGLKLSGIDLTLTAQGNAQILDVKTPTSLAGNDQSLFTQVARTIASTSARVSYSIIRPESELPTAAKLEVVLKGGSPGNGTLLVDTTKTKIVGKIAGYIYDLVATVPGTYTYTASELTPTLTPVVSVSATSTPTVTPQGPTSTPTNEPSSTPIVTVNPSITVPPSSTPTPGPVGNAKAAIALKFQGVVRKPVTSTPLTVKVTLVNQDTLAQFAQDVTFNVNDQGIWSGNTAFNAPVGPHYYVLVKGPKHLQKKICVTSPTETAPGTYRCANGLIGLKNGDNTFDFGNIYLLVGDLPDQNGVVDSYDISFIRNNLGSTDAKNQLIGDLNYDGRVDSQDYSLVIASLSIKKDEE
ncbi:MAG: hypothetical protein RI947_1151 [Candidatus Parcubacteria bacterium]